MAGGNLPFGLAPSGALTSYTPTLREKATDWMRRTLFSDDRAGQGRAEKVMDVASMTPFGFGLDVYDAGREAGAGNLGTAGIMGAMAMAPGLKTRGGKPILPFETGWVFKDVKSPNKIMGKGDWRLTSMLEPEEVEIPIGSLNATQHKVNPDFSSPQSANSELPFVIKKNGEYFVQDGHHRLTKIAMDGRQTAKVRLVDLDGTRQSEFPLLNFLEGK
jgi:hypothetical protein